MDCSSPQEKVYYRPNKMHKGAAMYVQDMDDKRRSVRMNFVADATITINPDNKTIQGKMINLSIHGMLIEGGEEIAVGTPCTATIIIEDRNSLLTISNLASEVVRNDRGEIGLRFLQPFAWLALFHIYQSKSRER